MPRYCIEEGCKTRAYYNYEGEKKAIYCNKHKKENMIDVVNKRCLEEGCNKRPSCNYEGEKKAIYCNKHKKENMIDVVSKRCLEEGCNKHPSCNYEGKKAIYCNKHKKENMIDVVSKRCLEIGCIKHPSCNYEGKKPIYCNKHKKENMIDVVSKRCKTHLCDTLIRNDKYKGYCLRCFMYKYPDLPVSRNYKTKEFSIVDYVKREFKSVDWIADKIISGGCSPRRPDLLCDLGYQVLIIEIDERQHGDYECSCENKRLMEISRDIGHRPIVMLRFNPDGYTSDSKKITSCWGLNKKGICVVKKSKVKEWENRLETLGNQIRYWINPNNKTDKTIETIHLFYDE